MSSVPLHMKVLKNMVELRDSSYGYLFVPIVICHYIPKPHHKSTITKNSEFEIVSLYFQHTVY
jgi:hypothetical protein